MLLNVLDALPLILKPIEATAWYVVYLIFVYDKTLFTVAGVSGHSLNGRD